MIPRSTKSAFADLTSDGEDSINTTPTTSLPPTQLDVSELQQHPKWSLRTPLPIYTPTRHGSFHRSGSAAAIRPLHTPKQHQQRTPGTNATIAFERASDMASDSSNHNNSNANQQPRQSVCGGSTLLGSNGSFSLFASTVNPLSESRMALYTSVNWPTKPVNSLQSLFENGFDAPPPRLGSSTSTTSTATTISSSRKAPPPLRDFSTADPNNSTVPDAFGEPMTPLTQATGFVNAPTPGGAPPTILPPVIIPATPLFTTTSPQLNSPTSNQQNRPSLATHFTRNQFNAAAIPFHRIKPYLTYIPQSEPADMPYRKLSEVLPGLFLSGEAAVTERDRLLPQGIKLIITMNGDKHVPPYRVYEYNTDKGKFLHRKIRSREEFVQEMKEEFKRLYRTGACPGCCPPAATSIFSPVSSSAFASTITAIPPSQPSTFSCEACGITAIPTVDEPPLVYAVREHLGACEDEERLQTYLAAQQTTPSSTSGVTIPPHTPPTLTTADNCPKTKIFVRSIAADDSPVYDLSPHFLEISCLIHIVLEEYRRVQLLWSARQVKREDANIRDRDTLLRETLPFACPGVAIHCLAGVSRSTSVLAAYLMKLTRVDVEEILACIKNRRVIINPNPGFRRQLSTWQLQKYFIAHDEGACAMIARQIAQASSNTAEASSLPCSTTSNTERLDQGIGRLAIEEQIRTLEGLLTVYATTNRSTRERRNFGIIVKHLCVEPDTDSDTPTRPSLPLHEVTKLVVMFLREQVLNEIHVDCPGLFTNWCEIVGSIIGHCGGRAMASTLLKVIAEKLQCRFTAVEMYRANLSPIVCIACDALFGVSFIRTYEALAHEAEEANRPIRKTGKFSEATKELLHRMTPLESSITSAELSALSSGPCSPMLPDSGGGGVAAGGGLYCGPNAMDPLLALHHANVSTGLPRMKELLSAAAPPCSCGQPSCKCVVPQVIRLTYLINATGGSGDGQAEDGSGDDEHLPSFQPGSSPVANIPLTNFSIPEPGHKRTRVPPQLQQQDAEESSNTGVSSSSLSIVVAPARDPSYDVRGRTPATAAKLVPLTMALDLYGGDGDAEASMDADSAPTHTSGTPMPQNIVVSYPFLDCMASFAVWEREAPTVITPAELAEALGVSLSTVGGPEGHHGGGGAEGGVVSSSSLRSGGLTLQLPSRRRGQKDGNPIAIATGPSAEEEAAFQDCMARLTAKQKQAIASNAILQITKLCNKMRDFIQEVTGGGTAQQKPKIPTVSSRTTGSNNDDNSYDGDDTQSSRDNNNTVAVTPIGIDLEATLFTELVTSASSATLLDSIEARIITFLGKKQTEYCARGTSTSMWTLHTDATAFAKNAIFESVVVARLDGDVQLELIGLDDEEEGGSNANLCNSGGGGSGEGSRRCPNSLSASYETLEGEVLQAIIRRKVASAFMAFSHLLEAW